MKVLSLSVCCLAGALGAQTYVSPGGFSHSEGSSNNVFPFGSTTVPFRYAQIHDDVPSPMVISGMAFRHNATTTIYAAHSVTVDAWMSTAATTSTTPSGTFDNNHGANKIQVITNRTYNMPASDPSNLPGEFVLDYPFDVPFVYLGGGSLCWEVIVTAKTQTTSVVYDFVSGSNANPPLAVNRAGTGCLSTGRTGTAFMTATGTSTMTWASGTGTLNVNGTNLLANGALFHTIGFDKNNWGPTPLPSPIPTSTGSPSGTCTVYAEVLLANLLTATATGTVASPIAIPATPTLNGLTVLSQLWGLDTAANPFGITTSNMALHNFVAPFTALPFTRIFASGSSGPTGTASIGNGLITKFY